MRMRNVLTGIGLALALASAANAGTVWRWTNADGVVAFSDDLKRIPEAYRDSAVAVKASNLASYKRFTPAPAAESKTYTERLDAHVARMRALNEQVAEEQRAAEPPAPTGSIGDVRVNRKLSVALPAGVRASDEPIVVEEHRVRDGDVTTHVYVVRQGDRILSVTRPNTNHSDVSWSELEDVLKPED
jgi:hypothetical protein